jgi:dolichol-phosphate mannosyltransferase
MNRASGGCSALKCLIVLPCFNEEKNIGPLVSAIGTALSQCIPYEVVAVNDGSYDGTREILKSLSARYPLRLLEHETNKGLAAALETGLEEAVRLSSKRDYIITMDADDTHDPRYILRMLEAARDFDIVVGSRYVGKGTQLNVPYFRVVLSKAANFLIRKIMQIPIMDVTSGYRCYRASTLQKLDFVSNHNLIESKGFEASLEILAKAFWCNSTITEIPITLDYGRKRSKSKMRLFPTVARYLRLLLRGRSWARDFREMCENAKKQARAL